MTKKIVAVLMLAAMAGAAHASQYDQSGFVTEVEDGRLWVFKEGSNELQEFKLQEFKQHGEPAKQYSSIGAGPDGMTVKAADEKTLVEYLKTVKK